MGPPGTYNPTSGGESIADCTRCSPTFSSPFGSTSESACVSVTSLKKPADVCPPGTTKDADGCTKCPQGTYSDAVNSACVACPIGTTSPIGSKSEKMCVADSAGCPMGTYGTGGNSECTACPPGSFLNFAGATSVDQCRKCPGKLPSPAGSFSKRACGTGDKCPAGTFAKQRGALFFCKKCPENTYSAEVGAQSVDACILCPTDATDNVEYTSPRGSTSETACVKGAVQPTMAPTMAVGEFKQEMVMTIDGVNQETFNDDVAYTDAFAGAIESSLFDPEAPDNEYEVEQIVAETAEV